MPREQMPELSREQIGGLFGEAARREVKALEDEKLRLGAELADLEESFDGWADPDAADAHQIQLQELRTRLGEVHHQLRRLKGGFERDVRGAFEIGPDDVANRDS